MQRDETEEGQMDNKGRRAPRAGGPTTPAEPVALDAAAPERFGIPGNPPEPAEIIAEAGETMKTALDVVTSAEAIAGQARINPPAPESSAESPQSAGDSLHALAQSQPQAGLTRDLEVIGVEVAGMALSGIDSSARTASDMLSVKTFSEVVALNAGLACTSLDTLVGGSIKLSELAVKLASEAAQSMLAEIGKNWLPPSRIGG
jgi:Phasin protein